MKKIIFAFFVLSPFYFFAQNDFKGNVFTLKRFMEKYHYKPIVWNDSSSTMFYNKWMRELDDEKLIFTQDQINKLEWYKKKIGDDLSGKSCPFFNQSTELYRTQLLKCDSIIKLIGIKPFDFSKPDNFIWPFSNFAMNNQELAQRWMHYIKWQVAGQIADKITDTISGKAPSADKNFNKLENEARARVIRKELFYINTLIATPENFIKNFQDAYLNTLTWCYDPHSDYMNLKEKNQFEAAVTASEFSAGLEIDENDKGDKVISFLQPGGSAWRSGKLHKGDVIAIIKINGAEKMAADLTLEEMSELLAGASQNELDITVKTVAGEVKTAHLIKEKMVSEESVVKSYVIHGKQNIGYINLPGFYSKENSRGEDDNNNGCANDVSKEIVKLKKDTISGLILDLRFNGGGSMWEALQLAGIFIDYGPLASEKDKDGKIHFLKDPNRGTIYDGPLLVLVNGSSASASEFLSASLQDYNRAIIVGSTTYGKGTAQVILPMDTLSFDKTKNYSDFVKLTVEKFYRVNGSTTQWKGVVPDIELPDLYGSDNYKEKINPSALQPDNSKSGIFQPLPVLPVSILKEKSKRRVDSSPYFNQLKKAIEWMQTSSAPRNVNLQWTAYLNHFIDTRKLYTDFENENLVNSNITVTNNSFDWEQVKLATARSKEVNSIYIKQIEHDGTLVEACNILLDYSGK